ncbi:MAG: hypothetical protein IPM24_05655 [Bryobacterales bacterium]|nr:hypothetical protein [Bryobacterales bacterium]
MASSLSRRSFLALPTVLFAHTDGPKKRVAALISEYRRSSHADVICGRMLAGRYLNGQEHESGLHVVSMYTDQVPEEDLSRDLAAEHGFKIQPSIREALTMTSNAAVGERTLAVDGVVLICEHGAYPYNAAGQKLYPRFEFFKQVIDVFRETGQTCPVFTDKHLSYDWHKAKWMYDQAKQLGFPLMAGSVLPHALEPEQKLPMGTPVERAVLVWAAEFFDSKDSYGFHALERMQCQVERRAGGETGIAAVQCFEHDAVWAFTDKTPWAARLLDATAGAVERSRVKNPVCFYLQYESGLEAAIYRLNRHRSQRSFAYLKRGSNEPALIPELDRQAKFVAVPDALRQKYRHNHFSAQVHHIEEMIHHGETPNPVERTLLTTGALAALFESTYQGAPQYGRTLQHGTMLEEGRRISTPHLRIAYQV